MLDIHNREGMLILVLATVVLASGADLVADLSHGATLSHVFKEAIIMGVSAIAMAALLRDLRKQSQAIVQLQQELDKLEQPHTAPKKYILEARKTLDSVISQQFSEWKLTQSEADVGRLLLKGLSLKEIAAVRQTLEKTVRQQASSIYKKADVSGRHAFSAWFMEDIL